MWNPRWAEPYHPADGYVDMADGDVLVIGGLRMMLTLFDAHAPPASGSNSPANFRQNPWPPRNAGRGGTV